MKKSFLSMIAAFAFMVISPAVLANSYDLAYTPAVPEYHDSVVVDYVDTGQAVSQSELGNPDSAESCVICGELSIPIIAYEKPRELSKFPRPNNDGKVTDNRSLRNVRLIDEVGWRFV